MTPCPPSRATLETVLNAIGEVLPPGRQRQDMSSAVRQVAKALGKKPEEVPADPRLLSIRLKSVSPEALGYAPARWNNIRSLLRKALALVQPVMPGNSAVPLSPAWEVLFEKIKGQAVRAHPPVTAPALALGAPDRAGAGHARRP